jgi:CRP/FNR family transcriptional regulator
MAKDENYLKRCENCIVRQFNALRAMDKEALKQVSDAKTSKRIKKGDTIFKEGEKLNGIFCVKNGITKLSKLSSNGKDQIIKIVTKGDVIGHDAIITEVNTTMEATAINDVELCFIPKETILKPLKANPNFTVEILKTVINDLKEAHTTLLSLSQKSVKQRLAQTLIYLDTNYGTNEDGFLKVTLTREELSSIIGTALESCIRTISSLKKEKMITVSHKKIKIINRKALQRLIDDL